MQNRSIRYLFLLLIFTYSASYGQKLINSPLSRFNLGSTEQSGSFRSLAMGGTGIAFRDNSTVYYGNPASYSSFDTLSFVFDFGLDYGMIFLKDGADKFFSEDMNFDHLLMGFPLSRKIGLAIGVVPATNGYYKISRQTPEGPGVPDAYYEYHSGEGGFSNFFIGTGVDITKNISAGVNLSMFFGDVKRLNQFEFTDYAYMFHNNSTENLSITGLNLDYGLQYSAALKNNYYVNAGLSLTFGKNYNTNYEKLVYRFNPYSSTDTISYVSDNNAKSFLPSSLRAGVAFGKKNKFTIGLDYIKTNWADAKIFDADGYLADSYTYMLGIEYIPEKYSNYSALKRMEYRLGGHTGTNYLFIDGAQVKEAGVSFGMGIPLRKTLSKTNFFIDYTKKSLPGSTASYTENYLTMGLSLNFYDRWFIKRKYD